MQDKSIIGHTWGQKSNNILMYLSKYVVRDSLEEKEKIIHKMQQ